MPRYVVLLRAIGPATHKVMSMADLVRGCEAAGLRAARTYIQTGNILLTSDWPAGRVQAAVAGVISGFGLDNAVVVRTIDELAAVVAAAPFPDAAADHPSHLAICFLASEPAPERWARVEAHPGPERTKRVEAELAVDYPVGIGTSKFAPGVIERRLGVVATARNWNTVLKLLELGQRPMSKTKDGTIRIGVGGWTFEPWRGPFYPETLPQKRELEHASRQLTAIEINGTYYGSQKPESFAKWHDETPEGFVFTVKGPRFATNRKDLALSKDSVERFLSSGVTELREKLGPINWQFLPTKAFDPENFEAFLSLLPKSLDGRPLRHAVEVRHGSFVTPDFVALARAHGVAVVTAGDSEFPQIADVTAPFVYVRIMGGTTEGEAKGYSEAALKRWVERARAWAAGDAPTGLETVSPQQPSGPRDVFLFVISGFKERNPAAARAMIEML